METCLMLIFTGLRMGLLRSRNFCAMRVKAVNSIALPEEFGNQLREPHSKAIEDGLFELRIKFASDITRIFYFFRVGNKIILTNGFVKKTQKTPESEKQLAKKYKADYERRYGHE